MRIHTLDDNGSYNLDSLPDEIDDLRFAILDNSNPKEPDYFYIPLIFLESFASPSLVLKIGNKVIKMPLDWHILIGEEEMGDLEAMQLTSINDRDFKVFEFNSLSSTRAEFLPIEVVDIYNEVQWYSPKLKNGQYLAVPLSVEPGAQVVYFISAVSRNCEVVDYSKAW
jgi:hypothetical protein